jgi:hypothetical protein
MKVFRFFVRKVLWRVKNIKRIISYWFYGTEIESFGSVIKNLKQQGYAQVSFSKLFQTSGSGELFARMQREAFRMRDDARNSSAMRATNQQVTQYVTHPGRTVLTEGPFLENHPFFQFAISPEILSVVSKYFGMHPQLNMIQLNWSYNFFEKEHGAYLWHKDDDDFTQLKVIVYLDEVTNQSGPFCFIAKTHPFGIHNLKVPDSLGHYKTDAEMERVFSDKGEWIEAVGPEGAVIFADTSGFHRGLKPVTGERLALFLAFTSNTVRYKPRPVLAGALIARHKILQQALQGERA